MRIASFIRDGIHPNKVRGSEGEGTAPAPTCAHSPVATGLEEKQTGPGHTGPCPQDPKGYLIVYRAHQNRELPQKLHTLGCSVVIGHTADVWGYRCTTHFLGVIPV